MSLVTPSTYNFIVKVMKGNLPRPSKNLKRYESPMNNPVVEQYGKKANKNPDTPCKTAPQLKQVLGPILVA